MRMACAWCGLLWKPFLCSLFPPLPHTLSFTHTHTHTHTHTPFPPPPLPLFLSLSLLSRAQSYCSQQHAKAEASCQARSLGFVARLRATQQASACTRTRSLRPLPSCEFLQDCSGLVARISARTLASKRRLLSLRRHGVRCTCSRGGRSRHPIGFG